MNSTRLITFWGLLLVLILLPSGCGSRQAETMLDDVESYIQVRPDSALAVLRALDTTKLNSQRLRAHYALLHAMALDKNWIDTTDAGVVMAAVKYYDRHRPVSRRAKPYYYLGRIQYNGGHYDEAILSFTRAREYAAGLRDDRFKTLIVMALANTFNANSVYGEAQKALIEAEEYAKACHDTSLLFAINYYKAQGFVNLSRFEDADSLFLELTKEENKNISYYPEILNNYAMFLITPPNEYYARAKLLYDRSLQMRGTLGSAQHWGMYAACLAYGGDLKKAETIMNQLEAEGKEQELSYSYNKSLISALQDDYQTAYRYLQENLKQKNEIIQRQLKQSTLKFQRDYYYLQRESLKKENRLKKGVLVLLVLFIVSAAMAVVTAIRRYRENERRQNQDMIEAVQDLMDKNNGLKQEYVHLGQEHYKTLSDLCNTYYRTEGYSSQANAVCGEVRGYLKTMGVGEQNYLALEQNVNEHFGDIMRHLRREHPNHREPFYQTACYIFAGFKSRTIALILNQDKQKIYKTKSLLRKEVEMKSTPHQKEFLLFLERAFR